MGAEAVMALSEETHPVVGAVKESEMDQMSQVVGT
jgi:hypothetical protein